MITDRESVVPVSKTKEPNKKNKQQTIKSSNKIGEKRQQQNNSF